MEALVEYNYIAQEPDELTICKGDIIKDIKVSHGGWWEGTLRDKRGMFPDNFVKILNYSSSEKDQIEEASSNLKTENVPLRNKTKRKFCKVLFSYEPCNEDELRLVPNDIIEYLGEVEEGWWRGRLKDKIGVFPSNFVFPTTEDSELIRSKDKKEFCKVLYPYEAANEDELTLVEGDIILLISKNAPDKGWWKGQLNGQIGLFPDNFVEMIISKNELPLPKQPEEKTNKPTLLKTTKKNFGSQKKNEKALERKSLDPKNIPLDLSQKITDQTGSITTKKSDVGLIKTSGHKPSTVTDSSSKHSEGSNFINGENGNSGIQTGEDLDEVERGEGSPLSHLTVSRAKAPRRRLPSAQHLKNQNVVPGCSKSTISHNSSKLKNDNIINGNVEETIRSPNRENGNVSAISQRQKDNLIEELKLSQLENKKDERSDLEKSTAVIQRRSRNSGSQNVVTTDGGSLENRFESKETKKVPQDDLHVDSNFEAFLKASSSAPHDSYQLYSQIFKRIALLEEKQTSLQHTVEQLSKQISVFISTNDLNKLS